MASELNVGGIKATGNISVTGSDPELKLADTGGSTTFGIRGNTDQLDIRNANSGAVFTTIDSTGAITASASGTYKLFNDGAADATLQLGPDTPAATRSGRIAFTNSSVSKNWFISSNWGTEALRIAPSTAGGGTTMDAPIATFTSTGLAVTGAVTATTLSTFSNGINLGNTASATATTLDGYEEGTFTVTTASDATGALAGESGEYTRIGNCVYIQIAINVSTNFTTNEVGGLPFAAAHSTAVSTWRTLSIVPTQSTADVPIIAVIGDGNAHINFFETGTTAVHAPNTTNDIYRVSGFYYTNDAF